MTWTKVKPQKAGFYWFKSERFAAQVVNVYRSGNSLSFYIFDRRTWQTYLIDLAANFDCEFSSEPIEKPLDS